MKIHYKYKTIMAGFAFMSIMSFWQMYDNIIPLILKNSFSMNEVIIGIIMAIDNVLALFLLPLFGTWSDKLKGPLGKRLPFIIVGTILADIAMFFMPVADNLRNLPMFLVMTGLVLVFMSVFRSPAVALMPDITPKHLRSKGNAIVNLMGTVGGIYALIMIKVLVGSGTTPNYMNLFISIILFMVISTVILVIWVKENKWAVEAREVDKIIEAEEVPEEEQASGSILPPDKKRSLIYLLVSVSLWYMAYNAVTTAFSRYATEVWGSQNGSYADYLMIATVTAIISYVPIGIVSGKFGRKKVILAGVIGLAVGFGLCAFSTSAGIFEYILFGLVGISWAAINVNSFPMVADIATEGDIGKFTGYYYSFSMAAQVITPILSGAFLEYVSYRTLFPYGVVFSVLAFITMLQVKHGDVIADSKKSILEQFDVGD